MSEKQTGTFRIISYTLFDLAVLYVSFLAAFEWAGESISSVHTAALPWAALGCFIVFFAFGIYNSWHRKSVKQLLHTLALALTAYFTLLAAVHLAAPPLKESLRVLPAALFLQAVCFIGSRLVIWHAVRKAHGKKRVLIVAKEEEMKVKMAEKLLSQEVTWFSVAGYCSSPSKEDVAKVDAVLVSPSLSFQEKEVLLEQCMELGKELLVVPDLFELSVFSSISQQIDDMLVLSVVPARLSKINRAAKRALDIVVSVLILILAAPIMLALFIAIPLTSNGPALYSQERTGRGGELYKLFKFRSMVADAEKRTGPVLATEKDPRITKIGWVIRLTRMDELPQLFNVLKGEMSLVGPRPERPFFIEKFVEENPAYLNRLAVKPGLTGLAQVMANYTTTVEDKLRYDVLYIRSYSIWLDIKILFQTILVVLQPEQASGVKETNVAQTKIMQKRVSPTKAAGQ